MNLTVVKKCTALENISHLCQHYCTEVMTSQWLIAWLTSCGELGITVRCHIRLAVHNLCHVFAHVVLKKLDSTIHSLYYDNTISVIIYIVVVCIG